MTTTTSTPKLAADPAGDNLRFYGVWLAVVGATMYGFCWALLCLVGFFPIIGRRHRHSNWEDLTKHSGRSGRAEDLLH